MITLISPPTYVRTCVEITTFKIQISINASIATILALIVLLDMIVWAVVEVMIIEYSLEIKHVSVSLATTNNSCRLYVSLVGISYQIASIASITTHTILLILKVDQSSMDAFPATKILSCKISNATPLSCVPQAVSWINKIMNAKLVWFRGALNVHHWQIVELAMKLIKNI